MSIRNILKISYRSRKPFLKSFPLKSYREHYNFDSKDSWTFPLCLVSLAFPQSFCLHLHKHFLVCLFILPSEICNSSLWLLLCLSCASLQSKLSLHWQPNHMSFHPSIRVLSFVSHSGAAIHFKVSVTPLDCTGEKKKHIMCNLGERGKKWWGRARKGLSLRLSTLPSEAKPPTTCRESLHMEGSSCPLRAIVHLPTPLCRSPQRHRHAFETWFTLEVILGRKTEVKLSWAM